MPQGIPTDQGRITRDLCKEKRKWGRGGGGTKHGDSKMTRFFDWESATCQDMSFRFHCKKYKSFFKGFLWSPS